MLRKEDTEVFWVAANILFIDFGSSYTRGHFIIIYHTDIYDLCIFLYECYISHLKTFNVFRGVLGVWHFECVPTFVNLNSYLRVVSLF